MGNLVTYLDTTSANGVTTLTEASARYEVYVEGDNGENAELMIGNNDSGQDFSNVDRLFVDWEASVTGDSLAANLGADQQQDDINDSDIDAGNTDYSLQKKGTGGFARQDDNIHVNTDSNTFDIGVGGQHSTSAADENATVFIYGIWGEDSNGNRLFVYGPDPAAPSNLSTTAASGDQIDLSWDATPEWGVEEGDYHIYRAQASGSSRADYTDVATVSAGTTTYSDTGLEDGEQYFYRVAAENSVGQSPLTVEVSATTSLPSATIDTITKDSDTQLTVTWTKNDDSSDGSWELYRSTDGSLGSQVHSTSTLSDTDFTDSGLTADTEYWYTVRRVTDHTSSDQQQNGGTVAEASNLSVDAVNGDQFDLSWSDNSTIEDGYRVYLSTDGGSTFSQDGSDLAANTTSTTTSNLLDGEQYVIDVRAIGPGLTGEQPAASTVTDTTELPDLSAGDITLGNGVEDEINVSWTDVIDNGDYRIQAEETDTGSDWSSSDPGWYENTVGEGTTSDTITGREDGEEYRLRMRTETAHVTGAWTSAKTIVTKFPAATNLSVDSKTATSVDLSWSDNSDNEDGFRVRRAEKIDGSFTSFSEIVELGANVTSYTDSTPVPNTTYQYKIRGFTEHTTADSGTVETTTNSQTNISKGNRTKSKGWYVEVVHSSGAVHRPQVLDDVSINPSVNGLPSIEVPVPRSEKWQDSGFEDATLRVYKDGQPQPVDRLNNVRIEESRAVLIGEGGTELKARVQADYQFHDAHTAADNLITNNTTYTANVDDPASTTTEVTMQDADSTSEWESVLSAHPFASDIPLQVTSGELQTHDTAFYSEARNFDGGVSTGNATTVFDGVYSDGEAREINDAGTEFFWDFTPQYDIPAGNLGVGLRLRYFDGTHPGFTISVEGTDVLTTSADSSFFGTADPDPQWLTTNYSSAISAGQTVRVRLTIDSAASDSSDLVFDAVEINDERYNSNAQDDTLTSGGDLTWPKLPPESIEVETSDASALNQVVAGRLDSTWNNTANEQRVDVSNDQGSTWLGDANSQTTDQTFSSSSGQIRARFTLSYFDSGSGPVVYDAGQTVDLFTLFSDQEDTPVLEDRSFDNRLLKILQKIADDKNFVFEVRVDKDYNFSIEWTQPGQRTSDDAADVITYNVEKNTAKVVQKAIVKGGVQRRRAESFTSNHGTFVSLSQDDLVEGAEAVYNPSNGTQFDRSDDYEMDYLNGEIKVLATGAMSDSTSYDIDYNYKPAASYTEVGVSDPKTIVRHVPSIHSEGTAEKLAYRAVQEFKDPVYEAEITVPKQPVGWNVIDEIDPAQVPSEGDRLQIRDISESADKLVLSLASRETLSQFFTRFENRLEATETKV